MSTLRVLLVVALAFAAGLVAEGAPPQADSGGNAAGGAAPAANDDAKPANGGADSWRPLFDGKTLEHWKVTDFGGQGEVRAEDGQLILGMGDPLTGVTWAGAPLPKVNYEIELEASRTLGSDFFCALTFPVEDSHLSLVLGGWGGAVTGLSSINGMDASENETTDYFRFEKGRWYKIRLRVTDQIVQAWIDGESILRVEYPGKKLSLRIEVDLQKPLGLSTFQTEGAIRNLRLRELPPAAKAAPSN
jgi:hypothetical protein